MARSLHFASSELKINDAAAAAAAVERLLGSALSKYLVSFPLYMRAKELRR